MAQQSEILLESGTNELEVLVFTLGKNRYGVNVAKVREAIKPLRTTSLPHTHHAVLGAFCLRDSVTALIDLRKYFKLTTEAPKDEDRRVIVMEFNDVRVGFLVDDLEQIYRVSWEEMSAMPTVDDAHDSTFTSICMIGGQMVLMVDFEKIVFDIGGRDLFAVNAEQIDRTKIRPKAPLLLAEDSPSMRKLIANNLAEAGYTQVTAVEDGATAWKATSSRKGDAGQPQFKVIITDIEMPQLDGLALCKRIKTDPDLKDIPVVVFSSLVSDDNIKKIESVGANAQITKPELHKLVELIDALLDAHEPMEFRPGSEPAAEPALA